MSFYVSHPFTSHHKKSSKLELQELLMPPKHQKEIH